MGSDDIFLVKYNSKRRGNMAKQTGETGDERARSLILDKRVILSQRENSILNLNFVKTIFVIWCIKYFYIEI